MKFIKKSVAVVLMLMASVPCLYAVHGNSEKRPTTLEEFIVAYDTFVSKGCPPIEHRVVKDGTNITIDLCGLNADDKHILLKDVINLKLCNGNNVEYVCNHGNSEKRPETLEEFIAAYNTFVSEGCQPVENRIVQDDGEIVIDLVSLHGADRLILKEDLKRLHLPDNTKTFVMHRHGNSKKRPETLEEFIAAYDTFGIQNHADIKNRIVKDGNNITINLRYLQKNDLKILRRDLNDLLLPPDVKIKFIKFYHGNSEEKPKTLDEFIAAYNTFSSPNYPAIPNRIVQNDDGIVIDLCCLNAYDKCILQDDLKFLKLPEETNITYISVYGNSEEKPKTLDEFIAAYNTFSSPNYPAISNRIAQKENEIIIDLHYLSEFDTAVLRAVLGEVLLPTDTNIKFIYAHGNYESEPTTWDDFKAAYSSYASPGFFAIKNGRITQERNKIIIDLHYLNEADIDMLRADLGKIRPPKGTEIKFIYTHGNSEKQPTTLEEFIASYDTFQGVYEQFDKKRINLEQDVIEINLHNLSVSEAKDLQNDLLFLHNSGNLRNKNVTFNKVVFITGQSNVEKSKAGPELSVLQNVTSKVYSFYKKGFVPGNEGRVWVELSEKLDQPSMLQVKLLDPLSKVMHGKIWGAPRTLDDFIKAYNSFSSKDYPTIEQRILKGEHGITVFLRYLNCKDAYGMLKDLRDLHLSHKYKLNVRVDGYGVAEKDRKILNAKLEASGLLSNEGIKFLNNKIRPMLEMPSVQSSPQPFSDFNLSSTTSQKFTSPLPNPPTFSLGFTVEKPKTKSTPSTPQPFSNFGFTDTTDQKSTSLLPKTPILNSETSEEKTKAKSVSNQMKPKAESVPSSPQLFSMLAFTYLEEESTSEDLIDSSDFGDSMSSFIDFPSLNSGTSEEKPKTQSVPSSPLVFDNFDLANIKKQKSTSSFSTPPILNSGNSEEKPKSNITIKKRGTSSKFSFQMRQKNQPA